MLQKIDAILIFTSNMNQLIEFYQGLGVPLKVSDHGGGTHAEADFGEVHFSLQPSNAEKITRGNVSFSFFVPNLEEYCLDLESKGLKFSKVPAAQPFGGVTAEIHDPDGNHIFLNRWQSDEEYAKNFPRK